MKIFMFSAFIAMFSSLAVANTEQVIITQVQPPVVTVPSQPTVTITIPEVQRPTIMYRWVPVYVNRPVVTIDNRRLLFKRTETVYQTTIEWVYQPYHVY